MRHGGFSYLVQIVMLTDYYVMFSVVEVKGQIFCDSSAEKCWFLSYALHNHVVKWYIIGR